MLDLYFILEIESRKFHMFDILKETIFYQTDLSYAFVNLKPILPGRMLFLFLSNFFLNLFNFVKKTIIFIFYFIKMKTE